MVKCNGRSGKSFLFKCFRFFMRTVNLSGRNPKLLDNPHVFDQVDKHSDFRSADDQTDTCRYLSSMII